MECNAVYEKFNTRQCNCGLISCNRAIWDNILPILRKPIAM